jgi:hypothetical protein
VLFLIAIIYLLLCMDRQVGIHGEGFVLVDAVRVLNGEIPHRDFYVLYGPGQFYILAALFKCFGTSVLVERAWDSVVRGCSVVLVFIIVSQVGAPRSVAFLASVASLVWLGSFGTYGYPVFPALAAALASLAFLVPAFGREGSATRLVTAGVCAGFVMLFRYDVGVAIFGVGCAILAFSRWSEGSAKANFLRAAMRALLLFGLGFAVVVGPMIVAFTFLGVMPDLIFDIIIYPAHYYIRMRSLPFPGLSSLWADPGKFDVFLPVVLCAAAVPAIVAVARNRGRIENVSKGAARQPDIEATLLWTLLALVIVTLVFFAKGVVRVSTAHMAMALISSLALTGVVARAVRGRGLIAFGSLIGAVCSISILTFPIMHSALWQAERSISWAMDPASWRLSATGLPAESGSCRIHAGFERMVCFPMSSDTMETVRYIGERTAPDTSIFIGLSRHDRIFANNSLLYFIMKRFPMTKWHEFDPGLQTTEPIQQEMIGELRRGRPELIVLGRYWEDANEPNESSLSSGVTILDDYLKSAFEPVATFGANTVLRARSSEQP